LPPRTELDAELITFIADKLKNEFGRRQLRAFLHDTVALMMEHHDVQAIANCLKYDGLADVIERSNACYF
jgi:hypothetical protein